MKKTASFVAAESVKKVFSWTRVAALTIALAVVYLVVFSDIFPALSSRSAVAKIVLDRNIQQAGIPMEALPPRLPRGVEHADHADLAADEAGIMGQCE
jgi:hypothetical protein